jgi:hypothetical protein
MAFLPEYKSDLFISYRRAINEGPDRWISSFQQALQLSLRRLVGDVVIWRDEEQLHTGDVWRTKLVDALQNAAIYLAVISRTYLESRECRNVLDLMLAALIDALGRSRRLFPVYMQPPRSEADVPPELQGTQKREFYERRPDTPLGFSELDARPDCLEFQQRLAWLAQEVTVALERLRDESLSRVAGRVFVADVEPALYRDRDGLCADLFDHRFLVAPEREYLWSSVEVERHIRADLEQALMSIHLVAPEGQRTEAEVQHARHQLVLAVEVLRRRGCPPPVVWIPTRDGASEALQRFLGEVDGPLADEGVEVLVGGIEELKTFVYRRLRPFVPADAAPAGNELVVLVEDGDFTAFGALRARLVGQLGVEVVPARLHGTALQDPAGVAQVMAGGPRCLVYWGQQEESWVQQVLRLPVLAGRLGRERLGILVAGPPGPEKEQFVSIKACVIPDDGGEHGLRNFLACAQPSLQ